MQNCYRPDRLQPAARARHGLAFEAEGHGDYTYDSGFKEASLILHRSKVDALVCDNDAVMIGMAGAAVGTNLINNVPMAVVMVSALGGIQHASPAIQHGFIAATIFGCDLGPNLTTVGSLATVLWLLILRQRNVDVTGLDYFKVGVMVTPLMLLAGVLDHSLAHTCRIVQS